MSDETSASDKEHEPTQKKLDDARKKGEFARSSDLNTAASYAGLIIASTALGAASLQSFGAILSSLIARSDALSREAFGGGSHVFSGNLISDVFKTLSPLFLLPALAVIASLVAQRSIVFAPDKIKPKLSRISPISNAKNKFGRSGLFEFAKSFAKLSLYAVILGIFLWDRLPEMLATMHLSAGLATSALLQLTLDFTFFVLVIAAALGGVDYIWQAQEHTRKNRMSRKEVMDEHKQSEGDPHMKQQRRQRGYEIAMSQMLAEVPEADVIVVNPTHYAVALKWDRASGRAPICIAKGVDEIAARIREIAADNAIPIHRDPPTARAIHATVDIGEEIQPEQYQAVAIAIRFAEKVRKNVHRTTKRP